MATLQDLLQRLKKPPLGCTHLWKQYSPGPYQTAWYCEWCRETRG